MSVVSSVSAVDRFSCGACDTRFDGLEEQRTHFKSDWHRFNLRRRVRAQPAVPEEDFEQLTEISSLSGSESSSESEEEGRAVAPRSPKVTFVESSTGKAFQVWRNALLPEQFSPNDDTVRGEALTRPSQVACVMCSGGHFAGLVCGLDLKPILHKTFHRYTTRRKAGGSQLAHDAANHGHKAKSAGASLRRYNEQALIQDIRELLEAWKEQLDQCELVFLVASIYTRQMFWDVKAKGRDKSVLAKGDPRIRSIPFGTRRPTMNECVRVLRTVLTVLPAEDRHSLPAPRDATPPASTLSAPPEDTRGRRQRQGQATPEPVAGAPAAPSGDSGGGEGGEGGLGSNPEVRGGGGGGVGVGVGVGAVSVQGTGTDRGAELPFRKAEESVLFVAVQTGNVPEVRRLLGGAKAGADGTVVGQEGSGSEPDADGGEVDVEVRVGVGAGVGPDREVVVEVNEAFLDREGFTALHLASSMGRCKVVRILLEGGASPCLVDLKGRTPYIVAKDKETRNEFRRYMGEHPDQWDYGAAKVPSALTEDLEREKAQREKEKKKAKAKKAAEQKKLKKEEELKAEAIRKRKEEEEKLLKDAQDRATQLARQEAQLTDRERRALAAERRLQALSGGKSMASVSSNGVPVSAIRGFCAVCKGGYVVPFSRLEYSYCSMECLKTHRTILDGRPGAPDPTTGKK